MKQTSLQQISTSQPTLMHEISMLGPPINEDKPDDSFCLLCGNPNGFHYQPHGADCFGVLNGNDTQCRQTQAVCTNKTLICKNLKTKDSSMTHVRKHSLIPQ